jgi:hypothetical protein
MRTSTFSIVVASFAGLAAAAPYNASYVSTTSCHSSAPSTTTYVASGATFVAYDSLSSAIPDVPKPSKNDTLATLYPGSFLAPDRDNLDHLAPNETCSLFYAQHNSKCGFVVTLSILEGAFSLANIS